MLVYALKNIFIIYKHKVYKSVLPIIILRNLAVLNSPPVLKFKKLNFVFMFFLDASDVPLYVHYVLYLLKKNKK